MNVPKPGKVCTVCMYDMYAYVHYQQRGKKACREGTKEGVSIERGSNKNNNDESSNYAYSTYMHTYLLILAPLVYSVCFSLISYFNLQ